MNMHLNFSAGFGKKRNATCSSSPTFSKLGFFSLCITISLQVTAQIQLPYKENKTLPYQEVINLYRQLDKEFKTALLTEAGTTDSGKPLHLFIISGSREFDPVKIRQAGKRIILIINAIHPGESCGVDASLLFADDLLRNRNNLGQYLDNTVVCIIPIYNVGGYLNRSFWNRPNQIGPEETGFRGNARNLDLNRDFVKTDTRNARSFTRIFHQWNPDVFLDTHVTDGSDHQYTITLISTNHQKIQPAVGKFMHDTFVPGLFSFMAATPYEMIPYVDYIIDSPESGISGYNDSPRYSTGYASLFNTIGFMTENHAYKPFPDRVESVYFFMTGLLKMTHDHAETIGILRQEASKNACNQVEFPIRWEIDTTRFDRIIFKGYKRDITTSPLTGQELMYYDHNAPFEMEVPYYNYFKPVKTIVKPNYYIIPQAWEAVIERLKMNEINMTQFNRDTILEVEAYYIDNLKYASRPYNGHFQHSDIQVRKEIQHLQFFKGDYIIPVNQPGNRYLIETLEPDAEDSFFSWNFFDPVLDRREYFSPSSFDTTAIRLLDHDPLLKKEFTERKDTTPEFAASHYAQLYFIYLNSPYAEKSYRRYPVYRLVK